MMTVFPSPRGAEAPCILRRPTYNKIMGKNGVYTLLAALVVIAAAAAGFFLWGRGMFSGTCEPKTRGEEVVATVGVWNPEGSALTVKVSQAVGCP